MSNSPEPALGRQRSVIVVSSALQSASNAPYAAVNTVVSGGVADATFDRDDLDDESTSTPDVRDGGDAAVGTSLSGIGAMISNTTNERKHGMHRTRDSHGGLARGGKASSSMLRLHGVDLDDACTYSREQFQEMLSNESFIDMDRSEVQFAGCWYNLTCFVACADCGRQQSTECRQMCAGKYGKCYWE